AFLRLQQPESVSSLAISKPRRQSTRATRRGRFFGERRRMRAGRLNRQQDPEYASLPEFALHRYLTAVFVDNLREDGQPHTHALRFGGEERVEDGIAVGWIDAGAAVDNGHFHDSAGRPRLHRD